MDEPQPFDISLPLASLDEISPSPPFKGTTAVIYAPQARPTLNPGLTSIELLKMERIEKVQRFAPYFGEALLLDLTEGKITNAQITAKILIETLKPVFEAIKHQRQAVLPPRLLLKTQNKSPAAVARNEYACLTVDAVEYLYGQDVNLIGIDSPAINPAEGSQTVERQMKERGISWLCALDLSKLRSLSLYLLVALPLFDVQSGPVPARAFVVPIPT